MVSIVHRTFNDPGSYERTVRGAHASDLTVSERGVFDAQLTIIDLDRVWLQRGRDNLARTLHIDVDEARRSVVFLVDPTSPAAHPVWQGVWRRRCCFIRPGFEPLSANLRPHRLGGNVAPDGLSRRSCKDDRRQGHSRLIDLAPDEAFRGAPEPAATTPPRRQSNGTF